MNTPSFSKMFLMADSPHYIFKEYFEVIMDFININDLYNHLNDSYNHINDLYNHVNDLYNYL